MDIIWRDTSSDVVYEEARLARVFNSHRPNHYPAAIVHAKSDSETFEAVKLAQRLKLQVSVRSGGHSYSGWSLSDNSILIDLSNYREIEVDVINQEAWISCGMKSDIDVELMREYGLMLGAGHHPDVGIGRYLLQGGLSWNCRNWGWACERVKALDVVTADGRLVRCSADEHTDLFWAARGAGPYFPGIVNRFQVQLLPAPKVIRSSGYTFSKAQFTQSFNWIVSLITILDDDTEITVVCRYPDDLNELCLMVSLITMKHNADAASDALLLAHQTRPEGAIKEWFCQEDSLEQEYENEVSAYPGEHRWFADNAFINNNADMATVLKKVCMSLSDRNFVVIWYPLAPQGHRDLPDMAFSLQSDHYVGTYAICVNESDDEKCRLWMKETAEIMKPFREGSFSGETDFQAREVKCWGVDQFAKLTEIRRRWDPDQRICGPLEGVSFKMN